MAVSLLSASHACTVSGVRRVLSLGFCFLKLGPRACWPWGWWLICWSGYGNHKTPQSGLAFISDRKPFSTRKVHVCPSGCQLENLVELLYITLSFTEEFHVACVGGSRARLCVWAEGGYLFYIIIFVSLSVRHISMDNHKINLPYAPITLRFVALKWAEIMSAVMFRPVFSLLMRRNLRPLHCSCVYQSLYYSLSSQWKRLLPATTVSKCTL